MISHRDLLLGLLAMMIWAGNTVVIKFITLEIEPFTGLALRFIVATLIFLPFFRWPGRPQFWIVFQVTLFMAILHWGSLIWAINRMDVSMAAILMQIQVIFAVLIGRFFFAEKFGWRTAGGIALGITGVIVLVGLPQNPPDPLGVLGMVFSMLALAISYARMKSMTGIAPTNYIAHMHVIGILPAIAFMFALEKPLEAQWDTLNYTLLIPAFLYQALVMSASHMLWQRLISRNTMSSLPNLTLLLPVFGVIFAMLFLGETITPTMVIGGAITTIGVGIVLLRKQKRLEG